MSYLLQFLKTIAVLLAVGLASVLSRRYFGGSDASYSVILLVLGYALFLVIGWAENRWRIVRGNDPWMPEKAGTSADVANQKTAATGDTSTEPKASLTYLYEEAYAALKPSAPALFQARKVGVVLTIPTDVRKWMISKHGEEAQEALDLVDGNVRL